MLSNTYLNCISSHSLLYMQCSDHYILQIVALSTVLNIVINNKIITIMLDQNAVEYLSICNIGILEMNIGTAHATKKCTT